jgi:hypothetical protein
MASACRAGTEGPVAHAEPAAGIDVARCLQAISTDARPDPQSCPAFLLDVIASAREQCAEAGGTLVPAHDAGLGAIDVDGNGALEYLLDQETVVGCAGAASLFSCGSLGCPKVLYEQRSDGGWRSIGVIDADAMSSIEVLAGRGAGEHRGLRVGCLGDDPCREYWYYAWRGERYEPERAEVGGAEVRFASSLHGLHALVSATDLLAGPAPGAAVIARYGEGTEVAVIGSAEGGDYYYVSPCNACASGFVPRAAISQAPPATPDGSP